MEQIILVDESNKEIGFGEKIKIHQEGKLHRAFSIFIFNSKNELLLQRRASRKYHSGGLWTNTCCSHPRVGEKTGEAAHRRLKQEMGFDCFLKKIFSFIYRVKFENGLVENEYDHVFFGRYDGKVIPNKKEAEDYKWVSLGKLKKNMQKNPREYSYWFKIAISKLFILPSLKYILD